MNSIEIFEKILTYVHIQKNPDIHLSQGDFPITRNRAGDLISLEKIPLSEQDFIETTRLSEEDMNQILHIILTEEKFSELSSFYEIDTSYYDKNNNTRYRINIFKTTTGISIAMRQIPKEIPTLEQLGFGETLKEMCRKNKGLILLTGPTGSGKSTNIAAMIEYINTNFKKHIITLEDPIEFSFESKLSLIHQREMGLHSKDFAHSMKSALREDPNVIMVGEMRDPETIRSAITLAETGHLVISTLHTNDTVQSIDRIVDVFPAMQQDQVRMQLAMSLVGIIAQRLIPRSDTLERVPAREILINNDAIRNLIISGKTHQMYSVIEIGQKQGMILMDNYLALLYKKGVISKDTLYSYARDKENIETLII